MNATATPGSAPQDSAAGSEPVLSIENLHVRLPLGSERSHAVEDVSYQLMPQEIPVCRGRVRFGQVTDCASRDGPVPAPHVVYEKGQIVFRGEDLTQASEKRMREVRGGEISMIFQEPMTALNPVMRIGDQIDEVIRFHVSLPRRQRRERALACSRTCTCPTRSASTPPIRTSSREVSVSVR